MLGGSYNQTSAISIRFRREERQRQFLSNIRFILRIGTQATEPAILWFERRIHRVKRLTKRQTLEALRRGSQRAATIQRFDLHFEQRDQFALFGHPRPQGAFGVFTNT